jgi:LacI family transcriptional regulator, galactose operon repressor
MATIKEIARRANVSIGTVDRVIHNRGRVSPITKETILKIIEDMNYKPNVFARNLKLGKTFNFGVLMPYLSQDSQYWELPNRGILKAVEELTPHKVKIKLYHYDKYSDISFEMVTEDINSRKLDGLLIAPVVSQMFEKFVHQIPKDFPFVFFDSFIPESNCIAYIGQDSFQSGVLAAKLMHILMKEKGSVAIVKFVPGDYVIDARADGFQHYLAENSNLESRIYKIDERQGVKRFIEVAEQMVSENNELGGIFVTYAATHQFAEYMNLKYPQQGIHVIGYDPVEENIRCLKSGVIDFLITQMPERQGYEGIYTLFKHVILNEKVEKKSLMPMHIVTKENVDYYFG